MHEVLVLTRFTRAPLGTVLLVSIPLQQIARAMDTERLIARLVEAHKFTVNSQAQSPSFPVELVSCR